MFITYNMPLGDLINKLLRGEVAVCESWLYTYIKRLTDGDKGKLRQALKEVDSVVTVWKSRYFIPTYEVKVKSVTQGGMSMSRQDLDDTYNEEVYLQKEGKTGLVADFLYEAIAKYGFINEHHRDSVESAWLYNDMEFLRNEWEYYVLAQIRSLREIICTMLGVVSSEGKNEKQKTNRPLKRIEDYPEMFGIDVCSELIGQSKHTIYKLTSHKEIPCYRAESGRILRFKRDEIITWMMAKRQETKQEFIESMELGFVARLRK